MLKKVSDYVADFLESKGIRHVFGIVGAGNAHLFDSIYQKGYTEIICVHHEQAATMAMQTYFRITGKLSASIITTGGGSTNAVTGVVSAWMDSIPGIIISGNENSKYTYPENPLRIWGVQGYDSVEMVKKVTKYADRVMSSQEITVKLEKAYQVSLEGKPGPSWIDIPMNIQALKMAEEDYHFTLMDLPNSESKHLKMQSQEVLEMLNASSRPLIWLGHGIRLANATHLIEPLLQKYQIPAIVSWAGIDMIDSEHPYVFGRAGVYGQRAANFILQNCDFLLTIGTRLAIPQIGYDLNELARGAKIAVVDIDKDEVLKHQARITLPIQADAKDFMQLLLDCQNDEASTDFSKWYQQCQSYQEKYPIFDARLYKDEDGYINSYTFLHKISDYFSEKEVIVTDMGTALLSGHQVLKIKNQQRLLTSTGLGEMGYGLPGAIGASFAVNKGSVVCLNCDGGMMMNLQELQTMVHHQLPIKLFIFNNDGYLMIKHTQKSLFASRYSGSDPQSGVSCPRFAALAKAFGIKSFEIRTWGQFDECLPEIMASSEPVICEVFTHPEQLFIPKLSLSSQKDGTLISPPLEDLSPFISRDELLKNMINGLHPKSELIEV